MLNVVSSRPAREILSWGGNYKLCLQTSRRFQTSLKAPIQPSIKESNIHLVLYIPYLVNQLKGYIVSEFVSPVSKAGNKLLTFTSMKPWTTICRYGDKSHVWGRTNARPAFCPWSYILSLWLGFLMSCCILGKHYAALTSWYQYCQYPMTFLGFFPITPV